MENRAGLYVNNLSGDKAYQSYKPTPLLSNLPLVINAEILRLKKEVNANIAILNELSTSIPNIDSYISMLFKKEALMSLSIEGAQLDLEDLLNPYIDKKDNYDYSRVNNYIKAIEFALGKMTFLPFDCNLIKETHSVLMQGDGKSKKCGEYRTNQSWMGEEGCAIEDATYIPPNPSDMLVAMSDLEKFIQDECTSIDPLERAALILYQFETIQPFSNGNEFMGRVLTTLYLIDKKIISNPILCISNYFKNNCEEYSNRISQVRITGDYEQWIKFFLEGINESAKETISALKKFSTLHNNNVKKIYALNSVQKKNIIAVFDYIEDNPIINIGDTADKLDIAYNTVASAVEFLEEKKVLKQTGKIGKLRVYSYTKYIDVLKKED